MSARTAARSGARALAVLAGRSPQRAAASTRCLQCGRTDATVVYRLGRRSARYWCRSCRAVGVVRDLSVLRFGRVPDEPGVVAPEAGPGPLADLVAEPVLAWAAVASRRSLATVPDKAAYYQLHTRFDKAVAAALAQDRVPPSLAEVDLALASGLPSVSAIVGRLHDCCYRTDMVLASLVSGVEPDTRDAVRARVEHARRWLATAARELCWIVGRQAAEDDPPAEPVAAAAKRLAAGDDLAREDTHVLRSALFGTDGGPQVRLLLRAFTPAEIAQAVTAYAESGQRPLREATLAALDGPLAR